MNPTSFYDQYWQNGLHRNPEWPEYLMKTLEPLRGLERVLDYGCGMGDAYQSRLAASVKEYVGADVSGIALSRTRERGFPALQIDPQTSRTEAPDATFDGALSVEVMEHLFDPLAAARELYRVLKPGGTVMVTVPNFGYHECRLLALLRAQVPSEPEDPKKNRYNGVHIRYFSKLMLTRLLRDAGFTDIRVYSFDQATIWDVFRAGGPFAHVSDFARRNLPAFLHLRFLQDVWPGMFAKRLRTVARKPA
ncbi:MAG TPA: class I SAM-dependent methyltransferase [Candidatus Limnocylindria bacterium]|nr:class I SAM-dependent methyltransferase [Candidatus Limnocylindria bacterium]